MTSPARQPKGTAATLKRLLRPLRPVLAPPWRLLRRTVGRDEAASIWTALDRARFAGVGARDRLQGRPARMRAMRRHELIAMGRRMPYYRRRVQYMHAAGRVVDDLVHRYGATSALELGPHLRPLVIGADVFELKAKPDMEFQGRLILHDAREVPWPIEDKAYDIFVALQVFEHLRGHQAEAFREVRRVARHAVLSLPIDWVMPDPTNIHHQLSNETVLGWFSPVRPTRVLVGNPGPGKRLLYVFENLPALEAPTSPT